MSIAAIIGTALRNIPWHTIATAAMEHAPEFYQKAKERFQQSSGTAGETPAETELQARIARLEELLLEQEAVIRQQRESSEIMAERCNRLEGRLFRFKIGSGALFVVAITLLALLLQ